MKYDDIHFNEDNINNFNEGKVSADTRDPRLKYQYNSMSPEVNPHGYSLSLACQSGTDIVHSIGNVTAVLLQFIIDQFPSNTFATAIPSTQLAHKQLKHTPKQIRSQPYPICIVNPRVSLLGLDDRLAAGSFATTNWSSTSNRFGNRSEMPRLLYDSQKGIEWRGKLNRVVVYLDFVLSFQSMTEQLKWASYLINRIPVDGRFFFDIDTALELAIPDGFLAETAKYAKVPIKDEKGSVSKFVDYLNMNTDFPVSYRFSSGRHKDAFYMYYMTSLLCKIGEFNYTTVNRSNGLVETDCPITFTLRCEFNTIGMYDLSVPNPGPYISIPAKESTVSIPIFSDAWNEKDFPLLYGWKIQARPIIKMDDGEKEVFIGGTFSNELDLLIDYHLDNHLDIDLFISIKLRENKCLINDGYHIDWQRRMLIFENINYACTYRLIIAVNRLYINDLLKEMYKE